MLTTTKTIYFVNKDNNLIRKYISSYQDSSRKLRVFIATSNGYGYGFVITKLKTK